MTTRFIPALAFSLFAVGAAGVGSLAASSAASAACGVSVSRPAGSATVGHTIGKVATGVTGGAHPAATSCATSAQAASVATPKTVQHLPSAKTTASNTKTLRPTPRAHAVVLPHSRKV